MPIDTAVLKNKVTSKGYENMEAYCKHLLETYNLDITYNTIRTYLSSGNITSSILKIITEDLGAELPKKKLDPQERDLDLYLSLVDYTIKCYEDCIDESWEYFEEAKKPHLKKFLSKCTARNKMIFMIQYSNLIANLRLNHSTRSSHG